MNRTACLTLLSLGFILILSLAALFVLNASKKAGFRATQAKLYLNETLGSPFMALATDCSAPGKLVAGLAECLGDIPGGYCYHTSCDVIQAPCLTLDKPFRVAILPVPRR
jgi:hypothetical protein